MSTTTTTNIGKPPMAALQVAPVHGSTYPAQFQHVTHGRSKRKLGNAFGLTNFGVNHTTLQPGAASALQHYHATQDEFVYILQGTARLELGDNVHMMRTGDCVGFVKNVRVAHRIVNASDTEPLVLLEVGDRSPHDRAVYPNDDLQATWLESDGKFVFVNKRGQPYE